MLTCPKCVSELTLPALGDTTTCPGCGLVVHISSLSPGVDGQLGRTATASYPDRDQVDTTRQVVMPKTLGRYDVETLLGTGGFSHVYLAHDKQLDRRVALKVMRPDRLSEKADVRALFEEARIAARLEHSGFVPVYDVAQDDAGRPFLVMKYLPGQSLRERIVAGRMSPTEVAQVIRKISLAMHFAHKQRLVHRDLKPSNILFDAEGEPHVADLGLAVTEQSQIRRAGEWAGTLPYMAPEQVRGETQRLDGRCDIWSIGVIFYELLTGLRPFRGETDQIGDEIQNREPRPPRQLDERIPAALEAMCLKCLRKSLHDRYLSAFDLAEDLGVWLTGSQSKPSAVASAPAPTGDSVPALRSPRFPPSRRRRSLPWPRPGDFWQASRSSYCSHRGAC